MSTAAFLSFPGPSSGSSGLGDPMGTLNPLRAILQSGSRREGFATCLGPTCRFPIPAWESAETFPALTRAYLSRRWSSTLRSPAASSCDPGSAEGAVQPATPHCLAGGERICLAAWPGRSVLIPTWTFQVPRRARLPSPGPPLSLFPPAGSSLLVPAGRWRAPLGEASAQTTEDGFVRWVVKRKWSSIRYQGVWGHF